jgi:hypothetical protein
MVVPRMTKDIVEGICCLTMNYSQLLAMNDENNREHSNINLAD